MDEQAAITELKLLTREHRHLVWQMAKMGGELKDEDRRTVEAMAAHPEYAHLWDRLNELSDEEITRDGTNPLLHVTVHEMVESQIAAGDPPAVKLTLERLEQRGVLRHEATHQIGRVLIEEIWHVMSEQQPFNSLRYAAKLAELVDPRPARPKSPATGHRRRPKRRR